MLFGAHFVSQSLTLLRLPRLLGGYAELTLQSVAVYKLVNYLRKSPVPSGTWSTPSRKQFSKLRPCVRTKTFSTRVGIFMSQMAFVVKSFDNLPNAIALHSRVILKGSRSVELTECGRSWLWTPSSIPITKVSPLRDEGFDWVGNADAIQGFQSALYIY